MIVNTKLAIYIVISKSATAVCNLFSIRVPYLLAQHHIERSAGF